MTRQAFRLFNPDSYQGIPTHYVALHCVIDLPPLNPCLLRRLTPLEQRGQEPSGKSFVWEHVQRDQVRRRVQHPSYGVCSPEKSPRRRRNRHRRISLFAGEPARQVTVARRTKKEAPKAPRSFKPLCHRREAIDTISEAGRSCRSPRCRRRHES